MLKCKAIYTGGNNRRHNALQQELVRLLRLAGANVICTPGVTAFTGAEPSAKAHEGRMVDIGVYGLDNGHSMAIDLCVSDCGTGKPPARYMSGAKCETKGQEKRRKYVARFPTITEEELCCPGYGASGARSKEAIILQKRITKAQ